MARLFILPKKAITTAIEPSNAAAPALQRLAALERAKASLQETCQRLTTALDRANKLYGKIEIGTDRFVTLWNASHPDQMIRRCRLARWMQVAWAIQTIGTAFVTGVPRFFEAAIDILDDAHVGRVLKHAYR